MNKYNDKVLINKAITLEEDKRNVMEKHDITNGRQVTIDETPTDTHKNKTTICQRGKSMGNSSSTATHRRINSIIRDGKHVQFINSPTIAMYHQNDEATILT